MIRVLYVVLLAATLLPSNDAFSQAKETQSAQPTPTQSTSRPLRLELGLGMVSLAGESTFGYHAGVLYEIPAVSGLFIGADFGFYNWVEYPTNGVFTPTPVGDVPWSLSLVELLPTALYQFEINKGISLFAGASIGPTYSFSEIEVSGVLSRESQFNWQARARLGVVAQFSERASIVLEPSIGILKGRTFFAPTGFLAIQL